MAAIAADDRNAVTPKSMARMALRVVFLGLLMLFFFRSRWLPDVEFRGR